MYVCGLVGFLSICVKLIKNRFYGDLGWFKVFINNVIKFKINNIREG